MTREDLLLLQLSEEAAEVIQEVIKVQRFGLESHNPYDRPELSNRERLAKELADFMGIYNMLIGEGVLPTPDPKAVRQKQVDFEKFARISQACGRVEKDNFPQYPTYTEVYKVNGVE